MILLQYCFSATAVILFQYVLVLLYFQAFFSGLCLALFFWLVPVIFFWPVPGIIFLACARHFFLACAWHYFSGMCPAFCFWLVPGILFLAGAWHYFLGLRLEILYSVFASFSWFFGQPHVMFLVLGFEIFWPWPLIILLGFCLAFYF